MTAFRFACVLVSLGVLACQTPPDAGPSPTRSDTATASPPAPSTPPAPSMPPAPSTPSTPPAPTTPPAGLAVAAAPPEANLFSLDWARANHGRNSDGQAAARLEEEGHRLYKQKKDAEAVEVYERSLRLYASSSTYYKLGNSLSNVGRLEDAVKAYDIALGLALGAYQPELVHYNRACAYSRLKQADAAHAALAQAFDAGYAAPEKLNTDPDLAFLRAQPDWQAHIEKFRPTPAVLRGQFTEYGDRDYQASFTLCPDRRVFQEVSTGLDGSCCGSTRQGQLGLRGDQLLVTWSRECGLVGVGGPKRKKVPEETCTPHVGCTQVAECRPRSGESHLAKMSEIPEITKQPPGKPETSNELVYVPFPKELPAACTRPSP